MGILPLILPFIGPRIRRGNHRSPYGMGFGVLCHCVAVPAPFFPFHGSLPPNWTTYVYAVMIGRTVDAALGYYINPLLTVFLGVVVLRERIRPLQWAAIVLGAIAVAIVAIGVGSLPWISLLLAGSFSVYSLVKKRISGSVQPLEGMALETTLMSPFLLVFYGVLLWGGQTSIQLLQAQSSSTVTIAGHVALLVGSGALTVVPLLLFAGASGHLPLGVLGLIQYLSPSIQFILRLVIHTRA